MKLNSETSFTAKDLFNTIIILSLIIILISLTIIASDIYDARSNCIKFGGDYKLTNSLKHLCDNKSYIKYTSGWAFESEHNFSLTLNFTSLDSK